MNKKGAITSELSGLAYGIVALAIIVGVGSVVMTKFGETVANCPSGYTYDDVSGVCSNGTDTADPSSATQNVHYLNQQLGQSGLSGWVPAVIALTVGLVFLYMFLRRKSGKVI